MKTLIAVLFVMLINQVFSQSIEIGSGAEIYVGSGSDICATSVGHITGNVTGPGSQCNGALPVLISSFSYIVENESDVKLSWTTTMEINNKGFDIERKISGGNWQNTGWIGGHGNISVPVTYTFSDRKLNTGKYLYRLKQIDYNGNFEYHSLANEVEISKPGKFVISQNYPNPSNPVSRIDFQLPSDEHVRITVYDIKGSAVATILNEVRATGFYTVTFDGTNMASGIYFYKIEAGSFTEIRKMVLIK